MTSDPVPLIRRPLFAAATAAAALAIVLTGCSSADEPTVTSTPTSEGTVATATPFPTGTGAPGETGTATPTATPTGTSTATSTATAGASETPTPGEGYTEPTAEDAVAVLDQYFTAIGTGDYETAYGLWRNEGEASGQTYDEFVAGFDKTASISWDIGEPGRIDAGAGQRYIEIPVTITARTTDGETQHFEGSYVLHHTANIPGATSEQLQWRIDSADMTQTN